jgi:glyoxylase-like metal-dependent hydrolase (beta-lactamase superfamily II)
MPNFICTTCGSQYPDGLIPPEHCAICTEERQYVGWKGQLWTTLDDLRAGHRNRFEPEGEGLIGIGTEPGFAIGQRALHLRTPAGGVLWDCISLVDDATIAALQALGGVRAMAISHPHFYGSMVEWSRALGGVPIYLHAADRAWVLREDRAIQYWEGDTLEIVPGVTLVHCGGHFAGSTVLHWSAGGGGLGALLTSDTIMVNQDRRTVSFMYSYPNLIPLGGAAVRRITAAVQSFEFEQLYGGWSGKNILEGGAHALRYSARRYLHAIAERDEG